MLQCVQVTKSQKVPTRGTGLVLSIEHAALDLRVVAHFGGRDHLKIKPLKKSAHQFVLYLESS